ncbi:MAG: endolytic transglycosylase MltG [Halothiobacillaceae bacterium]|nr:endolytic transglycosylase MltG [Halothiobacillaceae bacterium]
MLAILMGLAAWGVRVDVQRYATSTLPLSAPLCVTVERGARLDGVLDDLAPVLAWSELDRWRWRVLARMDGNAGRLRAGEYRLEPGITPSALLGLLASGQGIQHKVTLVEGMTLEQVRDELAKHPALAQDGFALRADELMRALGDADAQAEGNFMPETYVFTRGDTDLSVLKRAHEAMQQTLAQLWAERDPDLPLQNPQQALILASIVEKETGIAAERAKIAGVFINRLRKGMKLQTDPTVIYGIGHTFDGNLRRRDLERDTPWNTYTRSGLPPSAIALPSKEALRAVMHPDKTTALYFVADGRGGHVFSDSLDAHNRAVRRYISGKN